MVAVIVVVIVVVIVIVIVVVIVVVFLVPSSSFRLPRSFPFVEPPIFRLFFQRIFCLFFHRIPPDSVGFRLIPPNFRSSSDPTPSFAAGNRVIDRRLSGAGIA